jgi:hypothetical protein
MENRNSQPSRSSLNGPLLFAVVPTSLVGKFVAALLTLTFAALALLMFGVILAGAVILAAVGVLILMLKRPRTTFPPDRRLGQLIEGEHTVESVDGRSRPSPRDRR